MRQRLTMGANFTQAVDEFRHEALMYAGMADFLAGTVPFIRGGLEAGEPVLVVELVVVVVASGLA